jgi:hypothetical protein
MESARIQDSERAGQSEAARDRSRAIAQAEDTVETTDDDARVYADAEGTGGQGRHFEEEGAEEATGSETAADSSDNATSGGDDKPRLDIQA